MANKKIKVEDLLDFSDWTLSDVKQVQFLNDAQLAENERLLTYDLGEMSQIDHVAMVVTYKKRIQELESK